MLLIKVKFHYSQLIKKADTSLDMVFNMATKVFIYIGLMLQTAASGEPSHVTELMSCLADFVLLTI